MMMYSPSFSCRGKLTRPLSFLSRLCLAQHVLHSLELCGLEGTVEEDQRVAIFSSVMAVLSSGEEPAPGEDASGAEAGMAALLSRAAYAFDMDQEGGAGGCRRRRSRGVGAGRGGARGRLGRAGARGARGDGWGPRGSGCRGLRQRHWRTSIRGGWRGSPKGSW